MLLTELKENGAEKQDFFISQQNRMIQILNISFMFVLSTWVKGLDTTGSSLTLAIHLQ